MAVDLLLEKEFTSRYVLVRDDVKKYFIELKGTDDSVEINQFTVKVETKMDDIVNNHIWVSKLQLSIALIFSILIHFVIFCIIDAINNMIKKRSVS